MNPREEDAEDKLPFYDKWQEEKVAPGGAPNAQKGCEKKNRSGKEFVHKNGRSSKASALDDRESTGRRLVFHPPRLFGFDHLCQNMAS